MKIAIYSRKSKSTDKGESIDNQIHMCKEYATTHFDSPEFSVFQDEGFSGSNTNRPQFQILLQELKQGMYDVLICYRLDRISRNVSDFSSTLDMLTKKGIGFVSIKENFDTTTPMGRAMIHISSVFAQLERETIAERIRDNLLELAKTGRWLGGSIPLGYSSKKVAYESSSGKSKYYSILERNASTSSLVQLIYNKYLELGSISKVETYLLQQRIYTPNNAHFRSNVIRGTLLNPVYCQADIDAISYFKELGCSLFTELIDTTKKQAIMPYNRHKQGKMNKVNDYSEWIIAIGKHEPIIDSSTWLKAQKQLTLNAGSFAPNVSTTPSLLSGIIFCKNCGSIMRVTNQTTLADGSLSYIYRCEKKLKSRGKLCNVSNAKGHILDKIIIERIKDMLENESDLIEKLLAEKDKLTYKTSHYTDDIANLQAKVDANKAAIQNLIKKLALFDDSEMEQYIQEQVKSYHLENQTYTRQIEELTQISQTADLDTINIGMVINSLKDFSKNIENASIHERRELIRKIIKRVEWDGELVNIFFYMNELIRQIDRNPHHGSQSTYAKQ